MRVPKTGPGLDNGKVFRSVLGEVWGPCWLSPRETSKPARERLSRGRLAGRRGAFDRRCDAMAARNWSVSNDAAWVVKGVQGGPEHVSPGRHGMMRDSVAKLGGDRPALRGLQVFSVALAETSGLKGLAGDSADFSAGRDLAWVAGLLATGPDNGRSAVWADSVVPGDGKAPRCQSGPGPRNRAGLAVAAVLNGPDSLEVLACLAYDPGNCTIESRPWPHSVWVRDSTLTRDPAGHGGVSFYLAASLRLPVGRVQIQRISFMTAGRVPGKNRSKGPISSIPGRSSQS